MDTKTLYFLSIPDNDKPEGNICGFRYLSTLPSGEYCMKEIETEPLHGLFILTPQEFKEFYIPDDEMFMDPDLLEVLYQFGNEKQQKLWTYSEKFGICPGILTKVGGKIFVSVSNKDASALMDIDELGTLWNGSINAETLEPWVIQLYTSDTAIHKYLCDCHTVGLNDIDGCADVQLVVKLEPEKSFQALTKIARMQYEDGLKLYDGMEVDDLFTGISVRVSQMEDFDGEPIFRLILPDPKGNFPEDPDVIQPFSFQDQPLDALFPDDDPEDIEDLENEEEYEDDD